MLKEFAQYLVSLKENRTYDIHGETYSDHELYRIKPYVDRPAQISVTGLDSIVKLIRSESILYKGRPLFVRVDGAREVSVFSSLDDVRERDGLYRASCDVPGFKGGFRNYEEAIVELRSKFAPGEGVDYLLDLLSRISKENGVTTSDNGVSQTVEARQGVSLRQMVNIKPRVTLCPYRTFLEVEQPASEFLLRLDNEGRVGLFEADGGMWALEAKRCICAYFEDKLRADISRNCVIVMC